MMDMTGMAPDLPGCLKKALGETFLFNLEAHMFHWNVQGPTFAELHQMFENIYYDAQYAVDAIAEKIRALDVLAPQTPEELAGTCCIDIVPVADAAGMVEKLCADNALVISALNEAQQCAEMCNRPEVANFLQERMDRHAKWGWMLKATMTAAEKGTTLRRMVLYDAKPPMGPMY